MRANSPGVLLVFAACVIASARTCAGDPVSSHPVKAVWAWLCTSGYRDLRIASVLPVEKVDSYTEQKWEAREVLIRLEPGLTAGQATASVRKQEEGFELSFPGRGGVCPVEFRGDSRGPETRSPTDPILLLPDFHYGPDELVFHSGVGPGLAVGDYPPWHWWEASRLFPLPGGDWLLIGSDAHAYLIAPPPATIRMKKEASTALIPMRLKDNPFLEVEGALRLHSACRFADKVLVCSSAGDLAEVQTKTKPAWAKRISPFRGCPASLFATKECMWALVKGKAGFQVYSSPDGHTWRPDRESPLAAADVPVFMDGQWLLGTRASEKEQLTLLLWQKGKADWQLTTSKEIGENMLVLDAMKDPKTGDISVLVGERQEAYLVVRAVDLAAASKGAPAAPERK